jgi:hypothetical protein
MRSFKEYLTESVRKFDFRIKVAQECTSEDETKLKGLLERFSVADFKKTGKTPIQQLPLDFPQVQNTEVHIYEVSLNYPTTPQELLEYLSSGMGVNKANMVVRNPREPSEEYQAEHTPREGALLNDGEYKESQNAKHSDYFGNEYNVKFLQGLTADLKKMREARGEVIPSTADGKTTNEIPQNNKSPIQQSNYDPRKK